jgi:hypothetical protein
MALKVISAAKPSKEELYAQHRLKNSPLKTSNRYKDSKDAPSTSKPDKKRP